VVATLHQHNHSAKLILVVVDDLMLEVVASRTARKRPENQQQIDL
jgi:hypothetical protein